MSQFTVDQALQIAIQYQQTGQLAEAEDIYRQILTAYPDQADALHLLGITAHQTNRNDLAEQLITKALSIAPDNTTFRLSLGSVFQAQQRTDDAIKWYEQTLVLDPFSAEACNNLGVALTTVGRFQDAVASFEKAMQLSPGHVSANGNMGIALCHLGRYDEALRALRTAITYHPKAAAFHASLGAALFHLGQTDAAIDACQEALALDSTHGRAHQTLALIYTKLNRPTEATNESRLAAEAMPEVLDAQIIHGASLTATGRLDEAVAFHQQALAKFPRSAALHNNLGNTFKDQGQLEAALAEFRQAMVLDPAAIQFHSNYLYSLHFHPTWKTKDIYEEHRRFNQTFAEPLKREILPHANDKTPTRKLRIGYVSNQFRGHVIGMNMLPLLANHNREYFEIFCYSDVTEPDFYTFRFQQCADHWHSTSGQSSQDLAERIRRDRIDILVDLNMHLAGERLMVFARKPAPIQVAFAAYPGTTGLTTIDYRLTDENLEPSGEMPAPSSETAIRLPHSFWCYLPQVKDLPVNGLPAKEMGFITFGNLNNFCKLNEPTFELWAMIMRNVTRSRLIMMTADGSHRRRTQAFFEHRGIAPDRIDFVPRTMPDKYMRVYHRIDLGLDSFPYNGHNTSIDSFYMGVPVVTIVGDSPVSRAGWSQLKNLNLLYLAGQSPADFVRIAIELANNWQHLAELRQQLRPRMQASPLMNEKLFAESIEQAYRGMWQRWCQ